MITLQYLQELGTFTLELIDDLKSGTKIGSLEQRNVANYYSSYHYNNNKLLFLLRECSDGLKDKEVISVNHRSGQKLTLIKYDLIDYKLDLKKYSTVSFEEDWFALSTALQDEEIIELYLAHLVHDIIESTCSTDRILFNAPLLHEYYQSEQH